MIHIDHVLTSSHNTKYDIRYTNLVAATEATWYIPIIMKIYQLIIILLTIFPITIAPAKAVSPQNPQTTTPEKSQPQTPIETETVPTGGETIRTGAVLKVNGDAITSTAIIALLQSQTTTQEQKPDQQQFLQNTVPMVSDLVIKKVYNLLLYQHARNHLEKLGISEDALDRILVQKRKDILNEYGQSEARAREELAKKGSSIDEELQKYKRDIVISEFQNMRFNPTLNITRRQMLQYYNTNKQSQFYQSPTIQFQLIDIKKDQFEQPALAKAAAETALQQIKDGKDFAQVVAQFSHDWRKKYDGLWNPIDPDDVLPLYEPVMAALKKTPIGRHTDIIEQEEHLFIAKLIDYKKANVIPFSEAQDKIKQIISEKSWLEYQQKLGADLLPKASIGDLDQFVRATTLAAYEQTTYSGKTQ